MKLPHEIRGPAGEIYYRCRGCQSPNNLYWLGGTSCPCCQKEECRSKLSKEFQEGYEAMLGEYE